MFSDQHAHRYVCHYTSADAFLNHILPSLSLRMSRFASVNDPRESREWICTLTVPDELMNRNWNILEMSDRFTDYMKLNAKLLCVTRDDPNLDPLRTNHLYGRGYAHPSMWDRYAEGHAGVCLILDIEKLSDSVADTAASRGNLDLYRQGVSYADMPDGETRAYTLSASDLVDRDESDVFGDHQRKYHGELYFWKSQDWASEFEYRWVLLDSDPGDVYINIAGSLAGVVFGDRFPAHKIEIVAKSLSGRGMTFAKVRYRNGHPIVLPWDS